MQQDGKQVENNPTAGDDIKFIMGNITTAEAKLEQIKFVAGPQDAPSSYRPLSAVRNVPTVAAPYQNKNAAIWEIRAFENPYPPPRISHCSVYMEDLDILVIMYGLDANDEPLGDFWSLHLETGKWTKMNISMTPRYGAKAVAIDHNIWIFGGSTKNGFLSDLHVLKLGTGEIVYPETKGMSPRPCAHHVMAHYDNKILIYGGIDFTLIIQLYILDLETMEWESIDIDHGRSAAASIMYNDRLVVYGSSNTPGLLSFDFTLSDGIVTKVAGEAPPQEISNASFVRVDHFLLLIGGDKDGHSQNDRSFQPIYACDMENLKWFIIDVKPDGASTSFHDGEFNKSGQFLMPHSESSSVFYRPYDRSIYVTLGEPRVTNAIINVISIGQYLSILHLQDDMSAILNITF